MRNNVFFTLYGIAISMLSFFILLITYYLFEFQFEEIVGNSVIFCYKESYYLAPIRGLYFIGIVIGLIIGAIIELSYQLLKRMGVIEQSAIYFKELKNN